MAVLRELRAREPRFHLEVVGGARLWGGADAAPVQADGVHDHGLLGQRALTPLLLRSTYAMQMQDREEPFGLTVIEAMRAGWWSSPVQWALLPELVTDGVNGVIVPGRPSGAVRPACGRGCDPQAARQTRMRASPSCAAAVPPRPTRTRWRAPGCRTGSRGSGKLEPVRVACSHCGMLAHRLADGDHCTVCGLFTPPAFGEAER